VSRLNRPIRVKIFWKDSVFNEFLAGIDIGVGHEIRIYLEAKFSRYVHKGK
jgi:hypothetical protein